MGLGGSNLHIWAFERTKGIHLIGPKAGDTLRRCRLGIGNALGSNGVYLSPFGRFNIDSDKRVDFEYLGSRKSVHFGSILT